MAERVDFETGHYNFDEDIVDDRIQLEILKEKFESRRDVYKVEKNDSFHYDLKVEKKDGKVYRIEFKNDKFSAKTGNVFLEFESRNNPSLFAKYDLPRTDNRELADIWIFKLSNEYWQITANLLRQLVKEEKYLMIKENVGDKGTSKGYLFRKSVILPYMKKYEG